MRLVRTVAFYFLLVISYFVGTLVTILASVFDSADARARKFQKVAQIWANLLVWASGIPLSIEGAENIPKNEALIFASNHQGAADILIVLACIPARVTFIVKNELFSLPVFGWFLKQAGYIGVDRGTKRGAVNFFVDASSGIKKGHSILIFPEGTRSRDGNLQEFKRGSLLLAFKSKARIVPIAISGSFNILPKNSWVIHPYPVKVKIGEPISIEKFNNDSEFANKALHDKIQEMLSSLA